MVANFSPATSQPAPSQGFEQLLRQAVERALVQARRSEGPILVRVERELPRWDPWSAWEALKTPQNGLGAASWAWAEPARGLSILASGAVHQLETSGPARFDALQRECSRLRERCETLRFPGESGAFSAPLAFTGAAFWDGRTTGVWAGWPAVMLSVPRAMFWTSSAGAGLTLSAAVSPGSSAAAICAELARDLELATRLAERCQAPELASDVPAARAPSSAADAAAFIAQVQRATEQIRAGRVNKVVLARARAFTAPSGCTFDPIATTRRLRERESSGFTFAVRGPSGAWFAGATPEVLARVRGRRFETAALAGTAPRGQGTSDDRARAEQLLASTKDRHEHAFVVSAIHAALAPISSELDPIPEPRTVPLRSVHHLFTPISGTLAAGEDLLSVAARLHPTPAVGGAPSSAALSWLRAHEGLERGWYAGPIGWIDSEGGVLAVALRSALLRGSTALAFAGAGIVAGSDPALEWSETELKLSAIERALVARREDAE